MASSISRLRIRRAAVLEGPSALQVRDYVPLRRMHAIAATAQVLPFGRRARARASARGDRNRRGTLGLAPVDLLQLRLDGGFERRQIVFHDAPGHRWSAEVPARVALRSWPERGLPAAA
jgi:hypothetical protein